MVSSFKKFNQGNDIDTIIHNISEGDKDIFFNESMEFQLKFIKVQISTEEWGGNVADNMSERGDSQQWMGCEQEYPNCTQRFSKSGLSSSWGD